MTTHQMLRQKLLQLDQCGYKAYQSICGCYDFPGFTLWADRVQGDPFATPSQCRVQVPQTLAQFPPDLYCNDGREIALRDYLTRQVSQRMQAIRVHRGTGNSGLIAMVMPAQQILERTSVLITDDGVEIRFVVGLPAVGRRIAGQQAVEMLCEQLPVLVAQLLDYDQYDANHLRKHLEISEDADWLRQQLPQQNLIAFIADGSLLPRQSGVDDSPLVGAVPFQSPERLRVEFNCPHQGRVTGMGIPAGVTLIVGGGYHGKSTLLNAIERGVYNHIPGDGRERVMTHADTVKIRAEDGRSVAGVDISSFINHLPLGRSTTQFSTQNASGSTSQAASIIESLELGARVLLIDEDTSATNLMIRDRRMQALITKEKEPITPLVDKVRQLYTEYGVSSILVMGGSGDYFDEADTVIALDDFCPYDATAQAKALVKQYPTVRSHEGGERFGAIATRKLTPESLGLEHRGKPIKFQVRGLDAIVLDKEALDLSAVEQLVEVGQLRAIATTMLWLQPQNQSFADILRDAIAFIETEGFDILTTIPQGDLTTFRIFELAAAINRWRRLQVG
ncbi:MAG: ABC-ATPase domain-containing protein [Thermosynechococcaceae cyanobacterium]